LMAKDDLKNATGFKTMLVITDGMDNRLDKDRELNPGKKSIPVVLREAFQSSGIVLNIVGFKVEDAEEEKAKEQFQVIEDLPLPGKFFTVTDGRELAATLERAMKQALRCRMDRSDNVPVAGA